MKFYMITVLLAAATTTAALPSTDPAASDVISEAMARDADFAAAYNHIVSRSSSSKRATEKCKKNTLNPCCDKDDCESRTACYAYCGSSGWGSAGCAAGCATACPSKKKC